MKMKQTYNINQETMLLAPAKMIEYSTKVIEETSTIYTEATAMHVINKACLSRWTTYEGRRDAVIKHTKMKRKVPIPICAKVNIVFFPTHAVQHFDNHWLSLRHILRVEPVKQDKNMAKVTFTNGLSMNIPCSAYMIEKQMERAFECIYRMQHGIINEKSSVSHGFM